MQSDLILVIQPCKADSSHLFMTSESRQHHRLMPEVSILATDSVANIDTSGNHNWCRKSRCAGGAFTYFQAVYVFAGHGNKGKDKAPIGSISRADTDTLVRVVQSIQDIQPHILVYCSLRHQQSPSCRAQLARGYEPGFRANLRIYIKTR